MSNNNSKQLSKEQITQKLAHLKYKFKDNYWDEFQEQYQSLSQNSVKTPFKINPKLAVIFIGLTIVVAVIIYVFAADKGSKSTETENETTTSANSATTVKEKPKEEIKPAVIVPEVKKDSVIPPPKVQQPIYQKKQKETVEPPVIAPAAHAPEEDNVVIPE